MAAHPRRRPVHLDRTHRPTIRPRTRTDRHTPPTPARHTRTRRPTILRTRPEWRLPERDTGMTVSQSHTGSAALSQSRAHSVALPRSRTHSTTAAWINRAPDREAVG